MELDTAQQIRQIANELGGRLDYSLKEVSNAIRYAGVTPWDLYFAAALQAHGAGSDLSEIRKAADVADLALFERAKRRGSP